MLPEQAEFVAHAPEGEDENHRRPALAPPPKSRLTGKPATFSYLTPARVLDLSLTTGSFEQEHAPSSMWKRISRSVVGGPPKLSAAFDRAAFLFDREAPEGAWTPLGPLGRTPEAAGLHAGEFARLRTRLDPGGRTRLALIGGSDPTLVYVNGKPVTFATDKPAQEADISALLVPGENEISLLIYLTPRGAGLDRPPSA